MRSSERGGEDGLEFSIPRNRRIEKFCKQGRRLGVVRGLVDLMQIRGRERRPEVESRRATMTLSSENGNDGFGG